MTIEQVETEALKLEPEARAKLAEKLLRSLDELKNRPHEQTKQLDQDRVFCLTERPAASCWTLSAKSLF